MIDYLHEGLQNTRLTSFGILTNIGLLIGIIGISFVLGILFEKMLQTKPRTGVPKLDNPPPPPTKTEFPTIPKFPDDIIERGEG